jgi:hypothetical protein
MTTARHIVPGDFANAKYRVTRERLCPICGKPDWCLSDGETWALCQRIDSESPKWKDAGWFHRIGDKKPDAKRVNGDHATPADARAIAQKSNVNKLWSDAARAEVEYGRLPHARDDAEAVEFLRRDYALEPAAIPFEWSVFAHPTHGRGIVYPGLSADGSRVFKFKSFRRNEKGKRFAAFLFGGDGCAVYAHSKARGLVIVGGEEKAALAQTAGFSVVCPLTGEHEIKPDVAAMIAELPNLQVVVLAHDADRDGRMANFGTARALQNAGVSADKIRIVQWPDDAVEGYDLNDIAREFGIEAVRELLDSAPAVERTTNLAPSLAEFLSTPRPPLQYALYQLRETGS